MVASAKGVPDLMSLIEQPKMLVAGLETDDTIDSDLVDRAGVTEKIMDNTFHVGIEKKLHL